MYFSKYFLGAIIGYPPSIIDITDCDISNNKKNSIIFSGLRSNVLEQVKDTRSLYVLLIVTPTLVTFSSTTLWIHLTWFCSLST